jgi:hypothetical protein
MSEVTMYTLACIALLPWGVERLSADVLPDFLP